MPKTIYAKIINEIYTPELEQKFKDASAQLGDVEKVIEFIAEQKLAATFFYAIMDAVHSKELVYDFHAHKHDLESLVNTIITSGKTVKELLAEEAETFEYKYQRTFAILLEDFERRFNVACAFFLFHPEDMSKQQKLIDSSKKQLLNIINTSFLNEQKCYLCDMRLERVKGVSAVIYRDPLEDDCPMNFSTEQEFIVDFPSGVIFAKDWFRDDKEVLSKATDIKESQVYKQLIAKGFDTYGIVYSNSVVNNYAEVQASAEKNIVSIFVGNSSPDIFKSEDNKIVSLDWDDEDKSHRNYIKQQGLKNKGMVCTDLWRATLVDEAVLDKLFAEQYTPEEIAEIKKEWQNTTFTKINVKPGKYKVKYSLHKGFVSSIQVGESNIGTYFSIEPFEV